ncbi:hypothetical protein [Methylobacterium sp. WSM2598]|uniref:hypothetical protein n=1 Tax=Methylobacterium sp. WSM2598 TaxID=398261 RepID=UPI0012F6767B|nr:hypothetical protein [Methylobacterium sp. WSM2598]
MTERCAVSENGPLRSPREDGYHGLGALADQLGLALDHCRHGVGGELVRQGQVAGDDLDTLLAEIEIAVEEDLVEECDGPSAPRPVSAAY